MDEEDPAVLLNECKQKVGTSMEICLVTVCGTEARFSYAESMVSVKREKLPA